MNETVKQITIDALAPMFAEAREKGLWFYSRYADVWLTPDELEAKQAAGSLVWGPTNWTLRSPAERHTELLTKKFEAMNQLNQFQVKLNAWKAAAA